MLFEAVHYRYRMQPLIDVIPNVIGKQENGAKKKPKKPTKPKNPNRNTKTPETNKKTCGVMLLMMLSMTNLWSPAMSLP